MITLLLESDGHSWCRLSTRQRRSSPAFFKLTITAVTVRSCWSWSQPMASETESSSNKWTICIAADNTGINDACPDFDGMEDTSARHILPSMCPHCSWSERWWSPKHEVWSIDWSPPSLSSSYPRFRRWLSKTRWWCRRWMMLKLIMHDYDEENSWRTMKYEDWHCGHFFVVYWWKYGCWIIIRWLCTTFDVDGHDHNTMSARNMSICAPPPFWRGDEACFVFFQLLRLCVAYTEGTGAGAIAVWNWRWSLVWWRRSDDHRAEQTVRLFYLTVIQCQWQSTLNMGAVHVSECRLLMM